MKKFFTLVITLTMLSPAWATHLMGGEITATNIGGYDYEIHLTTYRDTLGIPMQTFASFNVSDAMGTWLFSSSSSYDTTSGYLLPLFPYGVEVYHFYDTITMPGPGEYTIDWTNCCRNGAIINASMPLSESMYLFTAITVYDTAVDVNSSPVFLNEPVVFMPVNTPWSYNPLPFDPDGDSLVWTIGVPWDDFLSPIAGYFTPPGDTLDPFSIDPVTGTVTWTPILEGNFVASIHVNEYRDGMLIGTIIRDMQMIVVNSPDILPKFSNVDDIPTNIDGYPYVELAAGTNYTLTLMAEDEDLGDQLRMEASGEPLLFETSAANFNYVPTGVNNNIEGTFNWTPANYQGREEPYIVVFRLDDYTFAVDLAVLFKVQGTGTAIDGDAPGLLETTLYPNPSSDMIGLRFELEAPDQLSFTIYNEIGQVVRNMGDRQMSAGVNELIIPHTLDNGQYYLVIDRNEGPRTVSRFVVTK